MLQNLASLLRCGENSCTCQLDQRTGSRCVDEFNENLKPQPGIRCRSVTVLNCGMRENTHSIARLTTETDNENVKIVITCKQTASKSTEEPSYTHPQRKNNQIASKPLLSCPFYGRGSNLEGRRFDIFAFAFGRTKTDVNTTGGRVLELCVRCIDH